MEEENEYPFYPELTEEGKEQAQKLMIEFEKALKEKAIKIIEDFSTNFYFNVLNEIESDHWTNYRTKILTGLCNYTDNKNHLKYDFARIRESIFRHHKEEIIKDLNQDLLEEIERHKKRIEYLEKHYQSWQTN